MWFLIPNCYVMAPKLIIWPYSIEAISLEHGFTYNRVCFYGPQRQYYNEVDLYILRGFGDLLLLSCFSSLCDGKAVALWLECQTRSRGYKLFMLSSAEAKIYPAHKC